MPGCAVHLLIAHQILERPPERSQAARAALLLGAVAPDQGYFPGGDRFVSDLGHYVGSAALTRALMRLARKEVEQAFALGWATHVVADTVIHPLINQAAGALAGQDHPLSFADDPVTHIRVEQGLDAAVAARLGRPLPARVTHAVRAATTELLERAYQETYGVAPRAAASVRAASRLGPFMLGYGRVVGWWLGEMERPDYLTWPLAAGFTLARGVTHLTPRSPAFGLAHPVAPPDWLFEEAARALDCVSGRVTELAAVGFTNLPDYNLDTGTVESSPPEYPLTTLTLRELARRIAAGPRSR